MKPRRCILNLLVALGCVGCASQPTTPSPPSAMVSLPGKETCFWTRNLFDWTVLDDTTLLVHAPMKSDAYLVKLFAPITDMDFDLRLGFQSPPARFNMICKDGHVIARGPIPQRELIVAVRALTPTEATQLLAASKAATHQPSSPPAASPQKPSG